MKFSAPRVLAIAAVAAFLPYRPAIGQQCVTGQGAFFTADSHQVVTCGARGLGLATASFSGKQYAFHIQGCSVTVYSGYGTSVANVTSNNVFGASAAYAHNEYRLRHIAVLDDFPYGIVSQSSEGWGLFKINYNGSGVISSIAGVSRFYFGDGNAPVSAGRWLYGSRLFRTNGRVYVVGHYLNQQNFDLAIFDMGTGSATPPMTFKSWIPAFPSTENASLFEVIDGPSGPVLYVFGSTGAHLFNVSDPANPQDLGTNTDEGLDFGSISSGVGPAYPRGTSVANVTVAGQPQKRLYTYPRQGFFYIYNVTNPASPQLLKKQAVVGGDYPGVGISSDGKLLALPTAKVNGQPMIRYYAVGGDEPREITHTINWNSTTDPEYNYEYPGDVIVVPPPAGQTDYKVLRSHEQRSFWDKVSVSCLDTTPTAGLSITRLTASGTATCSGNPTHGGAIKAFPGDQFTITNGSSGLPTPTVQSLIITDTATSGATYTSGDIKAQFQGGDSLTWTSPSNLTGEFTVTLTLNETPTPAVQYIYLCNDPDPALVVSQYMAPGGSFLNCGGSCGWLQDYTLKLSGASTEGGPNWTTSIWTVEFAPKADPNNYAVVSTGITNHHDGTLDLLLGATGTYRVTLDPEYPYTDTTPEKTPCY